MCRKNSTNEISIFYVINKNKQSNNLIEKILDTRYLYKFLIFIFLITIYLS